MITKIIYYYSAVSAIVIIGLFLSAVAMQQFLDTKPQFRELVVKGESPQTIAAACKQLEIPILANAFEYFVPIALLSFLTGVALFLLVARSKITHQSLRLFVIMVTAITGISFVVVQLWEPDYFLALCK